MTENPAGSEFDLRLRHNFGNEPELYERFRPPYFDGLFVKLVEVTELSNEARILEVGAGTGHATVPIAQRGYDLTAIEPSEDLAKLARQKTKFYPDTKVIASTLEAIELENESFDLVYSAMALHWVAEEVRFTKPHALLKTDGHLAILYKEPVSDNGGIADQLFKATLPFLKQYNPTAFDTNQDYRLLTVEELPDKHVASIGHSILFEPLDSQTYAETYSWSALEYTGYISTLSWVLALPENDRYSFLREVRTIVEAEFNNEALVRFGTSLSIAQKKIV